MGRRLRLLLTALPLLAAPVAAQEAGGAVGLLIRQGERWLAQDRLDLAAPPIERALAAEPDNPAVLAIAARFEIARGNREAANAYLARLERAGATAQAGQVRDALRAGAIDRTALEDARRLAREGRASAAVARYRALFGGNPPPEELAPEFAQAQAGAPETRAEGIATLGRLAARPNATPRTRLAYAQALTFDPATRADGIARLQALTDQPEVGAEARRAWSAAIGFAGNDPAIAPQAEAYLQRFPDDTEMRRRLEALRAAPPPAAPDPAAAARQQAFERLEAGAVADSARRFEEILRANPNDADALGGLGVIRLRQGNAAEARTLLERAIAADPANARNWSRALDAASYGGELATARTLLRRGDVEGAETAARRAALREVEDRSDAETLLGEIALRRGDATAAEARFRAALSRRPGFPPAQAGLNAALRAQGRLAEAPAPAPVRREPAEPRFAPGGGTPSVSPAAAGFRAEAARVADPAAASALLRNAVAAAPDDPWVRLDLARSLRRQGRGAEGRALVEELASRVNTPDAAYAAALLAEEDGRVADADAFLARIPAARRTADMARLATRIRAQREVAAATALLSASPVEGRTQLLTLAARPDPTGGIAAAVIRAFGEAGDRAGAAEAARVASVANRGQPSARVAVAGALLSAGLEAEANAIAAEIETTNPTSEIRRDLAAIRAGAAIRASDRLNEAGNQAEAFERLRPALADPTNRDAQLALARLYIGARQPAEALRIAEAALARDPRNIDVRRAAIDAALAAGNRTRAAQLLAEGQSAMPGDARLLLLEARVARDAGDGARARQLLEAAARQRAAELGTGRLGAAPAAGFANPFNGGAPSAAPGAPADRLAREIQGELAALRDELGPSIAGVVGGRLRSGDPGLDRLSELSGRIEGVTAVPGIGGRVTAIVEPVAIDAGGLQNSTQARNRFGTLALNGNGAPNRSAENSAAGVGLGAAYSRGDWLRLDIGTTPVGFNRPQLVGGVEVAPRLTDAGLRLRLVGERRGMNDSLLSWSGTTDPRTGVEWGPVTRTGGRGQIEFPLGTGFGYVAAGYYTLDGDRVASNNRIEAGAGASIPVWRGDGAELRTGVDLVYLAYERNLRYFTLGHGGYFSPQQYVAVNFPIDYRGRTGDLSYRLGATIGYASWREDAAALFPNDPGLQAEAVARAAATAGTPGAINAFYRGQNQSGAIGGVRADLDYALNENLSLGAGVRYDRASDFDQTLFQLRLRNRF